MRAVAAVCAAAMLSVTMPLAGARATAPPISEPGGTVVVDACEEGAPEGWSVIEEASGASELFVGCNFSVSRFHEDIQTTIESGTAISIEYFCTAAEAQDAFTGKTGSRDTETFRSPTKVVTEEGPAAKNKDNPQPDPIIGFGPEPYFLQEKAWELLNPQIVATIVVLTNERGPVSEDERFGVAVVEPAAIVIANNHRPTACAVPAIGAGASGSGGSKGGGPGRIVVVTGIGGAIAIGGVTIWRRRRNRPFNRPPSGVSAPPQCIAESKAFEQSRDVLLTLREAYQDLNEELLTAEKNHQNNIVKTHMLMGFEGGQLVGSTVADVANALRPRVAHVGRGQGDTWKPPGGLDAKMAAAFKSAMEVLERARGRVGDLRTRVSTMAATLSNLASHPLVREAQERATAALNAVRRGEQALAASSAARTALETMDDNIAKLSAATSANFLLVERLEDSVKKFRGWIADAEGEIIKLTETVDSTSMVKPAVSAQLATKQAGLDSMKRQLQRDLTELGPLKANHQDSLRNLDVLMGRRDVAMQALASAGDVLPRDLDKLREVHRKLSTDLVATQARVMGDVATEYQAARKMLTAAEIEESLAEAYLKGLRAQLERAGAAAGPSFGKRALDGTTKLLTLPFVPLVWLWEKGFGSVQSVPEAFEILIRGQQRLTVMTRNLTKIGRAIDKTQKETERLRQLLQTCIESAKPGADPSSAPPTEAAA